jgi:hypothetical protein
MALLQAVKRDRHPNKTTENKSFPIKIELFKKYKFAGKDMKYL